MKDEVKKTVNEIKKFQAELNAQPENQTAQAVSRQEFTLLLSGISACRKIAGIPGHMGYEKMYYCVNEDAAKQTREALGHLYGVHDLRSLKAALVREFSDGERYGYFTTFWVEAPLFDLEGLKPEHRTWFLECMDIAEQFYPILKEKGFHAWTINEKIGLCRKAAACGIITEEEFWELTDPWVRQAQVFYHSWPEYAISCLCGAVYFMRRQEEELMDFLQLNIKLVRELLSKGGAWLERSWYVPKEREWADLFDPNQLCLTTRKVLEEETVGYMYREAPVEDFPDCGWRFFTGEESEEYIANPANITIRSFSDICNLDPTILAYFNADYGREFEHTENGWAEVFPEEE